jgi:hypothetical protein
MMTRSGCHDVLLPHHHVLSIHLAPRDVRADVQQFSAFVYVATSTATATAVATSTLYVTETF